MLEMNKVYAWDEIVGAYPDKYAFITDIKEEAGEIISCKLLDIVDFKDIAKYMRKYKDKGIYFEWVRTTHYDEATEFLKRVIKNSKLELNKEYDLWEIAEAFQKWKATVIDIEKQNDKIVSFKISVKKSSNNSIDFS